MKITRTPSALTALLLLAAAAATPAQTPPPAGHPEISRETREKMAALHEQMATCLRSDKSPTECYDEFMKSCKEQLGTSGCPPKGMGHGLDPGHHMQPMSATPK